VAYVTQPLDAAVRLRLDQETFNALVASARNDERTLSAEVRLAIRRHLVDRVAVATSTPAGEPAP
jgi:hypothetical protein